MKHFTKCTCFLLCLFIFLPIISGCSKSYKSNYPVDDFFDEISDKQNFTLTYTQTYNSEKYNNCEVIKIKFTKNRMEMEEGESNGIRFIVDYKGNKTYCYDYDYKSKKWEKAEVDAEDYDIETVLSMFSALSAMTSVLEYDNIEKCYKGKSERSEIIIRFQGESVYMSSSTKNLKDEFLFEKIGGTRISLPNAKDIK